MKPLSRTSRGLSRVLVASLLAGGVAASSLAPAHAATEPVAAPLAAPTALTPDDSAAAFPRPVLKTPRLDWAPVAGATGYRVEVGTDATWSDEVVHRSSVFYSEYTVPLSLPNSTYVWRVAALKGSVLGHWSSENGQAQADAQFTKGWRAVPTLNSVTSPFVGRPTYSWSPVAGADAYELQASVDPFLAGTPTGPTADSTPSAGSHTQTPPGLITECFTVRTRITTFTDAVAKSGTAGDCTSSSPSPGTTVYWRVRALDAFATDAVAGSTQPASDAGLSQAPPTDPNTLANPCGASALPCTPSRPSIASAWSAVSSYTFTPTAPAGAVLTSVPTATLATDPDSLCTVVTDGTPTEAEHAVCRDVPTIRWSEVAGATRYRLTFALDDAFTNIKHSVESAGLEWTSPGSWAEFSATASVYYTVQACDSSGCGPVTTTPPSFTKSTPRPTLGATPANTGEMTLSWQSYAASLAAATAAPATQDAFAYHVQVARADHPSYDVRVDDVTVDETYLSPSKSYGDGTFVWRVQPVDNAGNKLPWSLSQSFTRDATPPRIISVTPSVKVGVKQPLKLTFSEPVTGLANGKVTLSPAAAATLVVTGSTTATLTPTLLRPGATYVLLVNSAVKDLAGNSAVAVGPAITVNPLVDDKSIAMKYTGVWKTLASSNAVGGTFHSSLPTPTAKTSASVAFTGTGVALTGCVGPNNGYVDLYIDNVKKSRVSLYRSFTGCGVKVAALTGLTKAPHTLKVVGIGARQAASKGNAVAVDAVTVTP